MTLRGAEKHRGRIGPSHSKKHRFDPVLVEKRTGDEVVTLWITD